MRYQKPSLNEAIKKLNAAGVSRIIVFPLFPQYSSAATGTVLKISTIINKLWNIYKYLYPLYHDPLFIESYTSCVKILNRSYADCFILVTWSA